MYTQITSSWYLPSLTRSLRIVSRRNWSRVHCHMLCYRFNAERLDWLLICIRSWRLNKAWWFKIGLRVTNVWILDSVNWIRWSLAWISRWSVDLWWIGIFIHRFTRVMTMTGYSTTILWFDCLRRSYWMGHRSNQIWTVL